MAAINRPAVRSELSRKVSALPPDQRAKWQNDLQNAVYKLLGVFYSSQLLPLPVPAGRESADLQVPPADYRSDDLLTTAELAIFLGNSDKTLNNWRCQGEGPDFTRIGRRIKYRFADVLKYLEENKRASTSDEGQ